MSIWFLDVLLPKEQIAAATKMMMWTTFGLTGGATEFIITIIIIIINIIISFIINVVVVGQTMLQTRGMTRTFHSVCKQGAAAADGNSCSRAALPRLSNNQLAFSLLPMAWQQETQQQQQQQQPRVQAKRPTRVLWAFFRRARYWNSENCNSNSHLPECACVSVCLGCLCICVCNRKLNTNRK